MRSADWRDIRDMNFLLGSLFLVVGVALYIHERAGWSGTVAPYRPLGILLLVAATVLLVVGFVSAARAKEEEKLEVGHVVSKPKVEGKKILLLILL